MAEALLVVTPTEKPGRYRARLGLRELPGTYRDPFTSVARFLLEEGADPKTKLVMTHEGNPRPCITGRLDVVADLTVIENEKTGPKFRKYQPMSAEMPFPSSRGRPPAATD